MASAIDFELTLAEMSDEELEASLGGRRPPEDRTAALRALVGRGIRRVTPTLRRIARSSTSIAPMRATAAIALGKDADPANQAALIAALKAPDDRVVRRAAEALGRIGDAKALVALGKSAVPVAPAAARAHDFARSLISYRLGLGSDLLRTRLPLQPRGRKDETAEGAPINAATLKRVTATLPEEAPGIALAPKGGVHFKCGRSEVLVLPAAKPGDVSRTNAVVAVALRRSGSLDRFALHLYLMAHPAGDGTAALFGVRPDGSMTHAGSMSVAKKGWDVRLEALDTPLSRPTLIEATLAPDGARIEKTKATKWQRPAGVIASRAPKQG